jgi:phosphotriesterase-related protein
MDRYPVSAGQAELGKQRNATVKAWIDRDWAHKLMLGHDLRAGGKRL